MDRLYKVLIGFMAGIVSLLLILQLVILLPPFQDKLKSFVVSSLEDQIDADLSIEKFRLGFPKKIKVQGIKISESVDDTLFYCGEFSIDVKLIPLLRKKIAVHKIELKNVKGDIGKVIARLSSGGSEADTADVADSSQKSNDWEFSVYKFNLTTVNLNFRDEEAGFDLKMDIGSLQLNLGDINPDSLIHCRSVAISNTDVSFELLETEEITSEEDTSSFSFADIRVGEVRLDNVDFTLIDSVGAMMLFTHAGELSVSENFVDITNEVIGVNKVSVKDSYCDLDFLPEEIQPIDTSANTTENLNWGQYLWRITGKNLFLENCRYSMDYLDVEEIHGHFDPNHINIYEASGHISDFILDNGILVANLSGFKAKEDNGFEILDLGLDLSQKDKKYVIDNFHLATAESNLDLDVLTEINLTDYTFLSDKNSELLMKFISSGAGDIDFFYPLFESFPFLSKQNLQKNIILELAFRGSLKYMDLNKFDLRFSDQTRVAFNGILEHLDHPDSVSFDMQITEIVTTKYDIYSFYPGLKNDSAFNLPEFVNLNANLFGGMKHQELIGEIKTSAGAVRIDTLIVSLADKPSFVLKLKSGMYNLTDIIDYGIDKAGFKLDASFAGSDLYNADGDIHLQIDSLTYLENRYEDLKIEGSIGDGIFLAELVSADTNLDFDLVLSGELSEISKSIEAKMDIRKIDLHRLGLYTDPFSLNTSADLKISYQSPEKMSLKTDIHSLDFHFSDTLYKMHPVNLTFNSDSNLTDLFLDSYFYHLDFESHDNFADFISAVVHLPGYYLSDTISTNKFNFPEFILEGQLEYPAAFARLFFPDLPAFGKLTINGHFDDAADELVFNLSVHGVEYGSISADSTMVSLKGDSKGLQYRFVSDFVMDDLLAGIFNISGSFEDSKLISRWQYTDSFSNPYLDFTLHLDTLDRSIVIRFIEDSLIFSYDIWDISTDNRVKINPEYVSFEDFRATSNNQVIEILSPDTDKPQDINLILKDFQMGSIEQLLALDTIVSGIANADFRIKNLLETPVIEGKLVIDNMSLMDFEIGKFNLANFKSEAVNLLFNLTMTGENENISANGIWITGSSENPLDLNLTIDHLDISQLEYALSDYIYDAKGSIQGNLRITGELETPVLNGSLHFGEAGVGIKALNNYFTLGDQPIMLNGNVLQFNNFEIRNKKNESAKIAGTISLGGESKTYHNLRIITDNMEIMNSTKKDNDILYGLLKARSDIEIKGTSDNITINSEVMVDKSTDVTYVFPDNLSLNNNDGIVQFNRFDPGAITDDDIKETGSFFSMQMLNNFKSRIEIEEGSKFNLYFDNSGENFLKASLNGFVNYNLVESNSEVSGTFTVESGTLHYAIPMVTVEEYEIEPGSYITLSNDVYNPYLSIVASSSVRASTEGLMASNAKLMIFKILLYMEGELNDVQLRFDISTETSDALVSARLAQLTEEERNVNALNLLVRGSFLISLQGDELGSTSTVDAQIDKFYAAHLNHLISENVSFVDLKFDVQSFRDYNSSGEQVVQRNYYYNIGKSFMNDRARINYKGSLGVTNDLQAEQVNSHFIQNELEIEMKITRQGNLKGVFFRKNRYEGLLEGEVIETGGGIRYSKDFYSLWDMFTNDKRQEESEKLEKTNNK